MNNQSPKITCLSSEEHTDDIRDYLAHYLGCIEICNRSDFFEDGNPLWKREVEHLIKNLGRDREEARKEVDGRKESWKTNCLSELRRIKFLRKTLKEDKIDNHLVERAIESGKKWRDSKIYKEGIILVKHWQNRERKAPEDVDLSVAKSKESYDLEKDVSVPIIRLENGEGKNDTDGRFWNKFPNQKVTLSTLLKDDEPSRETEQRNLLNWKSSPKGITYIHIPSNNMIWAEHAIARYFGEATSEFNEARRQLMRKMRTKTYSILQDRYWRSQLHGDQHQHPPHARHLHPLCAKVSSDPTNPDQAPNNIVLFMPYIHWDTSRKRHQFAKEISKIIKDGKDSNMDMTRRRKEKRQLERRNLPRPRVTVKKDRPKPQYSIEDLFGEVGQKADRMQKDDKGRFKIENPLGQYLLDATRLYEGMANYRDKMILRNYLIADPPLHPRRTLDQAYFWILNSTRERDRDQVVYRGTTAKPGDFHKFDRTNSTWTKHEEFPIEDECEKCKINIQKLSRVVMVDQLWMWILDESTIITCFPKRYGANKQDLSGVHKSIRLRLQDGGPGQVRSVYDLALIIIDECSSTFFDRTKKKDRQPQVIDEFSKAIGSVMYKQTYAFERLWHWTDEASEIYRSKGAGDGNAAELHISLLDINPEGKLEREIKDIIEELDIMLHITKTQKDILTKFIGCAKEKLERTSRDNYDWFKHNADERLVNIEDRIEKLEELRSAADSTANSVNDLVELKQQQASVVQAWQSVKQSEETIRQGRSIMVFTIVTIVFLPLSFMSSVFGMNNIEISGDSWAIKDEFALMFPISVGVIFASLLFAFNSTIRASIWFLCTVPLTELFVRTHLYHIWLSIDTPRKSIHKMGNEKVEGLKDQAKVARLKRRLDGFTERKRQKEKLDDRAERDARVGNGFLNSVPDFPHVVSTAEPGYARRTLGLNRAGVYAEDTGSVV